ncbi:MAG TPA: hypothetical protein VMS32_10110 [Verrucomicrobiae bacterium]|jgi:hypothetical protein|nr:hypothetical protein [Verrucomicrobiae bacterium]
MQKVVSVVAVLAVALAATPAPAPTAHPSGVKKSAVHTRVAVTPRPALSTLKYPIIVRVVSMPFCSALRNNIGPAVGALIQNDAIVAQSRPMFEDYLKYEADGEGSVGLRDMSLMRMENLVTPLVNSIATVDKLLDDARTFRYPPHTADEKRLLELRDKLQAVEAMHKASLDVISGFVASEQLAQLQLAGNDQNAAVTGGGPTTNNQVHPPTPAPLFRQDPSVVPGLPQNPYTIDPSTIPGTSLGASPIRHVIEDLQWTQREAGQHEAVASKTIIDSVALCGHASPAATAAPSPVPSRTP